MSDEDQSGPVRDLIAGFEPRLYDLLEQEAMAPVEFSRADTRLIYADTRNAEIDGLTIRNISQKPNYVLFDAAVTKNRATLDIRFHAANCIVYVGPDCEIRGVIRAHADNTLTWLSGENGQASHINITHWSRSTFVYLGPRVTSNGTQIVAMGEGVGVFAGEDCMFSTGVWLKTSDMHAIVDLETGQAINRNGNKGDIVLGKHVWVGQDCLVAHNVHIGRGAIIGAKTFVNKDITERTVNVGIPSREIRSNVSWLRAHVAEEPALSEMFDIVSD